jgi:cholera toxin transcriptional activator
VPGSDSRSTIIRFGVFEADPATGELRKSGRKIRIQEQPFQVLLTLLNHPGKLVSRDDLQKKLWPSDTFVNFDTGVNRCIKTSPAMPETSFLPTA